MKHREEEEEEEGGGRTVHSEARGEEGREEEQQDSISKFSHASSTVTHDDIRADEDHQSYFRSS